jgi:hypothetical protein
MFSFDSNDSHPLPLAPWNADGTRVGILSERDLTHQLSIVGLGFRLALRLADQACGSLISANGSTAHRISMIDALVRPIPIGDHWRDSSVRHNKYCAATSHLSAWFFGLRAIMSPAFGDPASLSGVEMLTPLISSPGSYGRSSVICLRRYCLNSRIPSS